MRIATLQQFNTGLNGILDNQGGVNKTQQQISTGRRVLTPADDPIAATKILQLQQELALNDQYTRNMTAADNRLKLEEATLSSVTDNLERLKELTVQAGGGSLTITDRQAIAAEIYQLQEGLADLLNTKDAGGEYIFAGFKGSQMPFVKADNGRYEYQGDEGQRYLALSNSTNVATGDNGKALFVDVPAAKNTFTTQLNPLNKGTLQVNPGFVTDEEKYSEFYPDDLIITFNAESAVDPKGANFTVRRASDNRIVEGMANVPYSEGSSITAAGVTLSLNGKAEPGDQVLARSTPKQSVTDTIFRLNAGLNTLGDNPIDSETLDILIEDTLVNLTNAQASVSEIRSNLGARLNVVENTRNLAADVKIVNQEVLSKLADVDYAEAVSRLAQQTFMLEAAQQSYVKISQLSLFNQI